MDYFNGKVVLVVGASEGLGFSVVELLSTRSTAKIIATSRSLSKIEAKINAFTNRSMKGIALDLSHADHAIDDMIKKVIQEEETGRIDVLINCAGMGFRGKVSETTLDVHRQIFQADYFGQVALINAVMQHSPSVGHIIQVSSVQGYFGLGERAPYSASKHALVGYIDSLRAETDETLLKISLVAPGYINTNHSANALTGTGHAYNQKDASTEKGYSSAYVAQQLLIQASSGKSEIMIADFKTRLLVKLRYLFPHLCFRLLRNRQINHKESFFMSIYRWLFS